MAVIPHIIEQHLEEAAFLWLLRDNAVHAPHYRLKDLAKLDERVEAHIDGVRIAGEFGWQLCEQGLEEKNASGLFAATLLAVESHDSDRINRVLAFAETIPEIQNGLFSAFGWASPEALHGTVKELLDSNSAFRKRIGLKACALHRVNPADFLNLALLHQDPLLKATALRTVGELGREDLVSRIFELFPIQDKVCQFWASWSALLLGNRGKALDSLKEFALLRSPLQMKALQVVLRAIRVDEAKSLLKTLFQQPNCLRQTIYGVGVIGDPYFIPWLIQQMENPLLSRLAGESFSMMTGVDLAYEDLDGNKPEGFQTGPTDDPMDENVAMDEDENLPWPNAMLLQSWWDKNQQRFQSGQRYLAGQLITATHCRNILSAGYQRQRIAASIEISLQKPGTPLFNTSAPGRRQQQLLESL